MMRERAVTDWAIGGILSVAFDCLRAHLVTRRPGQLIKRRKLRRGDQDDDGREPYGRTVRQSARRPGRPPGPAHPSRNEKRYHACKRQWPGCPDVFQCRRMTEGGCEVQKAWLLKPLRPSVATLRIAPEAAWGGWPGQARRSQQRPPRQASRSRSTPNAIRAKFVVPVGALPSPLPPTCRPAAMSRASVSGAAWPFRPRRRECAGRCRQKPCPWRTSTLCRPIASRDSGRFAATAIRAPQPPRPTWR